jgi:hypothetical protein
MTKEAAIRLAAGVDLGIIPARFLIGAGASLWTVSSPPGGHSQESFSAKAADVVIGAGRHEDCRRRGARSAVRRDHGGGTLLAPLS